MNQDDYNWLAADYVLGVMRGPEKAAFEAQMQREPALAALVLDWQKRLSLIDSTQAAHPKVMSDAEIDAALGLVLERVTRALDAEGHAVRAEDNPLASVGKDQLASIRPAVVRLIASYLVVLERLKLQQQKLVGASSRL